MLSEQFSATLDSIQTGSSKRWFNRFFFFTAIARHFRKTHVDESSRQFSFILAYKSSNRLSQWWFSLFVANSEQRQCLDTVLSLTSHLSQLNLFVLHYFNLNTLWDLKQNNNLTREHIRPLSKLAAEDEVRGEAARRTGVYTQVHEDSSIDSTKQFASVVEFRKRSIENRRTNAHAYQAIIKLLEHTLLLTAEKSTFLKNHPNLPPFVKACNTLAFSGILNDKYFNLLKTVNDPVSIAQALCALQRASILNPDNESILLQHEAFIPALLQFPVEKRILNQTQFDHLFAPKNTIIPIASSNDLFFKPNQHEIPNTTDALKSLSMN